MKIPIAVSTRVARTVLLTQKHSPTILFVAGVAGAVTATVLACRATLKLEAVIDENEMMRAKALDAKMMYPERYTEKDYKQDLAKLGVRMGVKVVRLYGPAIITGGLALAALTGSNRILTQRNAGLAAAYTAVQRAFAEYRGRVIEEYGPDKDRELRYGAEEYTAIEETDKGPKKVQATRFGPQGKSMYAKIFDQYNRNWNPTPSYNLLFLSGQQQAANDRLWARGHILLNDVYESIGLEPTTEGCVVGWVKGNGDNYVDFGLFDKNNGDSLHDFMIGKERGILLDFNVDGVVYKLIGKKLGDRNE